MLSFKQKLLITYLALFTLFIALMFPFTRSTVNQVVKKGMSDRANAVIEVIQDAEDNHAMIQKLTNLADELFFRVSVINQNHIVIFDSHTRHLLGPSYEEELVVSYPEVLQAFFEGSGYQEKYTDLFSHEFAYFAKSFQFHHQTYVLRISLPLRYINQLSHDLEIAFFVAVLIVLLLFSSLTLITVNYLTEPIRQIITATTKYEKGLSEEISEIEIGVANRKDEFGQLARTLHSLSAKVKRQISAITQEKNEKTTVLESLVEGICTVNQQNKVIMMNQKAATLLDAPKTLFKHTTFSPEINQTAFILLERCRASGEVETGSDSFTKDDLQIHIAFTVIPLPKTAGNLLLVIQDMTEYHKMETMRKGFVSNASHELKTPITIIRGFAETLHDHPELPPKKQKEITKIIVNHCEKMGNLISDLLALSDTESISPSRLSPCDLKQLMHQCVANLKYAYPDIETEYHFPNTPITLLADRNLLELAINNILQNGAKYSKGTPHLSLSLKESEKKIEISITDRGIGIAKEEHNNIFLRFYRIDKTGSKKGGGSGLGLSIVQMIISKHHGKIKVHSELGKGSTFTLILPKRGSLSKYD